MLEDDTELEAELAALVGGGGKGGRAREAGGKRGGGEVDLDAMVASCMKDYGSGDELSDTEDPDLLAELQGLQGNSGPITPSSRGAGGRHPIRQEDEDGVGHSLLQTIKDRIALYREAEQVATAQGEGGKARRAARGLRTLQELERKAARGGAVSEEEIPPPISTGRRQEAGSSAATSSETSPSSEQAPAPAVLPPPAIPARSSPPPPARQASPPARRAPPTMQPMP